MKYTSEGQKDLKKHQDHLRDEMEDITELATGIELGFEGGKGVV